VTKVPIVLENAISYIELSWKANWIAARIQYLLAVLLMRMLSATKNP